MGRKKVWGEFCIIDGCDLKESCRGWCGGRYQHFLKWGDPVEKLRSPEEVPLSRYKCRSVPATHPFAVLIGAREMTRRPGFCQIGEHRIVLFERIGEGPHPCHVCGRPVDWVPREGVKKLVVDHQDNDGRNNRPDNLLPSCHGCNSSRDSGVPVVPDSVGHGKAGQFNGRAVLTPDDVRAIRRRAAGGERGSDLAKEYGIQRAQMYKIILRQSWAHIPHETDPTGECGGPLEETA